MAGRLNGLEGEVRGETPADKVRYGRSESVDGVEEEREGDTAEEDVGLGDLRALLDAVHDRVLAELAHE